MAESSPARLGESTVRGAEGTRDIADVLRRCLPALRPGTPADQRWSRISSLLRPSTDNDLVSRALLRISLAEGTSNRARFTTDVLVEEGAGWAGQMLARHALGSATKPWQKRKLRSLIDEEHQVPATIGARRVLTALVDENGVRAIGAEVDGGRAVSAPSGDWLESLIELVSGVGIGIHRDVLLVELQGDPRLDALTDLLDMCRLLPVIPVLQFRDVRSCEEVIALDHGRSVLPTGAFLTVRADSDWILISPGGRALQDTLDASDFRIASSQELVSLAVAHQALELAVDPVLLAHRAKIFSALRIEGRTSFPLWTDARAFTRLVAFFASGAEAARLRQSLSGHLLNSGFAEESLSLLRDVPEPLRDSYYDKRMRRGRFATARFEEIASTPDDTLESAEARAAVTLLGELREAVAAAPRPSFQPVPDKVLSILHASAPTQSGGYAVRAHGLLRSLGAEGLEIVAYTRPGFPEGENVAPPGAQEDAAFDGIDYRRLGCLRSRADGEYQYMLESVEHYVAAIEAERPSVVHLRSTYVSALPGLIAAKRCGLPAVYEVSGMWELVYEAANTARMEGRRARTVRLENAVLEAADDVVTITEAMADIIRARVRRRTDIGVAPNAVDTSEFATTGDRLDIRGALGWEDDRPVVGYVGSFVHYEGLDLLLRAIALLRDSGAPVHLVLVGDGAESRALQELADVLGLGPDLVHFAGRVPHSDVARYYRSVDILAYPRRLTPATAAVSPLKPFEAMATRTSAIVSDVPALAEIAGDGDRATVFPAGSVPALADAIAIVTRDLPALAEQRDRAYRWVQDERSWAAVGGAFARRIRLLAQQSPEM